MNNLDAKLLELRERWAKEKSKRKIIELQARCIQSAINQRLSENSYQKDINGNYGISQPNPKK